MPDAVIEIGTIGGKWDNLDILDGEYLPTTAFESKIHAHTHTHELLTTLRKECTSGNISASGLFWSPNWMMH